MLEHCPAVRVPVHLVCTNHIGIARKRTPKLSHQLALPDPHGPPPVPQETLLRLLAGVLWLGNLEFVHDEADRNKETFVVGGAWCVM